MSRYASTLKDQFGRSIPGASIHVYNLDETTATLTADGGGPLANPISTDEFGNYHFNAAAGFYTLHFYYAGRLILVREGVPVGVEGDIRNRALMVPGGETVATLPSAADRASKYLVFGSDGAPSVEAAPVVTSASGQAVNSRIALASISGPVAGQSAILTEPERAGRFVFMSPAQFLTRYKKSLTSMVTADPRQGIIVPLSTDTTGASGAWVRDYDGRYNLLWFGAHRNDSATGTLDSLPAFRAVQDYVAALETNTNTSGSPYRGGAYVYVPAGNYYLSDTYYIEKCALIIEGEQGTGNLGRTTLLRFPANKTGIVVQYESATGEAGGNTGITKAGGFGSILRNLYIQADRTGMVKGSAADGILKRARAYVEQCTIRWFARHGIFINATSGGATNHGNANGWKIADTDISNNGGSGIRVFGSDANAGSAEQVFTGYNGEWGIAEDSFLGNTYTSCWGEANGVGTSGVTGNTNGAACAGAYHNGVIWFVVMGQAAAASTTEPGTNSAVWRRHHAQAAADSHYPQWVSGTAYKEGGAYSSSNQNARSVFLGCYTEGDQPPVQIQNSRSYVAGGLQAAGVIGPHLENQLGVLGVNGPFESRFDYGFGNPSLVAQLGGGSYEILYGTKSDVSGAHRLQFALDGIVWRANNSPGQTTFRLTHESTNAPFGRSANVPWAFNAPNLMVGPNTNDARHHTNGTAIPTTGEHAAGEVIWNRAPAVGGAASWQSTAAGTPGIWQPVGIVGAVQAASVALAAGSTPTKAEFDALVNALKAAKLMA